MFHVSRIVDIACIGIIISAFIISFFPNFFYLHWQFSSFPFLDQRQFKKEIVGAVISDVERLRNRQEFILNTQDNHGKLFVRTRLYPRIQYGDVLNIRCHSIVLWNTQSGTYVGYLIMKNISGICSFPMVNIQKRGGGNQLRSALFRFKHKAISIFQTQFPEPHASLLGGLILGWRASMPESFAMALQKTGSIHIIAVSGYNISLFMLLIFRLLSLFHFPRKVKFVLTNISIVGFVMLTGAASSAVRAGIMGILGFWAQSIGRTSSALHALLIAGSLMILWNPLIVRYDLGFQLSFLATLGLILFSSPIEQRLGFIPKIFSLRNIMSATVATNLAVSPLLLMVFHRVSFVSLFVNAMVLPIIPFIMVFGFLVCVASLLSPGLGFLFAIPTTLLLQWIISVIELFDFR